MTGLLLPDAGSLTVLGFDTRKEASRIQAAIGYMPQRFGLYEDLSVQENLDLYADLRGLRGRPSASAVFDELLSFTDLKRFTGRLAGKLSGGMKQKLGLACALSRSRACSFSMSLGLASIRSRGAILWKMVQDLTREGIGVVWSTAYLDEAEACASVLLAQSGQIALHRPAQRGSPSVSRAESTRSPASKGDGGPILAGMLDRPGIIDGVIQGEAIRLVTDAEG